MTRYLLITGRNLGQPYLAHEFERITRQIVATAQLVAIAANADGDLAANSASSD